MTWRGRFRAPRLGRVAAGIVVVGAATALGQGALVLAAPILTRLYEPAAFGLLSVYSAVLSVLVAGASLRFDMAIPMARDSREAVHLLVLSIALGLGSSLVLALVLSLAGDWVADALGAAPLIPFLWLLPPALFVASGAQALASWAVYLREFGILGRLRATQGIGQAVSQIALGAIGASPIGLVIGDIIGRVLGAERLLEPFRRVLRSTPLSRQAMAHDARDRWSFARIMTVASLLNTLSLQIPFLLIPALYDLDASGQYFLAYRVLVLPASLVAAAVSQVFFGEASFRKADPAHLHDLARSATVTLFVFSIPTYGVVAVAGSVLLQAVFGARWDAAGVFAQLMAPSIVLWSVANPISSLLLIGRRERESLGFTAAELTLKAASLVVGALVHSLVIGIAVLSLTSIVLEVGALWRFLRVATVPLGELVLPVGRIALLTAPLLLLLVVAVRVMPTLVVLGIALVGVLVVMAVATVVTPDVRRFLSSAHD